MPTSAITCTAKGCTWLAGWVPALATSQAGARCRSQPAAIWLRQEFPVHKINIFMVLPARYLVFLRVQDRLIGLNLGGLVAPALQQIPQGGQGWLCCQAVIDPFPLPLVFNQPRFSQQAQVLAGGGSGQVQHLLNFAMAQWPYLQHLYNAQAVGIA